MCKLKKSLFIALIVITACNNADITRYVDPNIGGVAPLLTTKNPTVHRPHSMIRVFPVTKPGFGDRYLSDKIYGFAVNMPAYRNGHVTELMPTTGKVSANHAENASSYDHDLEEVHPWKHNVLLEDHNIIAEWTTTERAVIYRFDFQNKEAANIIFRSNGQASFTIKDENSVQGGRCQKRPDNIFMLRFQDHPIQTEQLQQEKQHQVIKWSAEEGQALT